MTAQGFWICVLVATVTFVMAMFQQTFIVGVMESLFYYMGGIGVRQRSRVAAISVFFAYTLGGFVLAKHSAAGAFGIGRILFTALLLANVRAIWIAARWRSEGVPDEPSVRLNATIMDKIANRLPLLVWPKVRVIFYVFATLEIALLVVELLARICGRRTLSPRARFESRSPRRRSKPGYSILSFVLASSLVCHCILLGLSAPPRFSGTM